MSKTTTEIDHTQPIIATATCTIAAAKAAEGDKPEKLPRITIEAYNGGIMSVGWWGAVVINLEALQVPETMPLLFGHNNLGTETILGQADTIKNDKKKLIVAGDIMGTSKTTREVLDLAAKGFKWQASIGVKATKYSYIEAGETVTVNGQKLSGPFTFIEAGNLYETSIVPLGADNTTSAKVAANLHGAVAPSTKTQEKNMSEQTPSQPTADEIRATAVAEEQRIAAIGTVAAEHPEIRAKAIEKGWTPEVTEIAVLKASNEALKAQQSRPEATAPYLNTGKGVVASTNTITAAVAIRAGLHNAERAFGAETCNHAADLRINSITDMVRAALALSGRTLDHSRHETRTFLEAAFSTADISNIISNVANKFILEGAAGVESAWREISVIQPVVDFKTNTGVGLIMADLLKALGNGGKIQHGALADETQGVKADTKALMLGITRQDIINDDLGVLTSAPRALGNAAMRTLNADFWGAFKTASADAGNFGAGLGNATTGALTLATLAAAEALFLKLTDSSGNPLAVDATVLLTGTTNYAVAREIFVSAGLVGGSIKSAGQNIFAGMFKPVMSRYVADAREWYLVANPTNLPLMRVAFLNGNESPTVESSAADFDELGIQIRCYYDYGVAFANKNAAVKSTGQ